MIIHTNDGQAIRFDEPRAAALAWEQSQERLAFQEIRRALARGESRRGSIFALLRASSPDRDAA